MAEQTVGRATEERTVRLHPGDRLCIELEENPTTGYVWQVEVLDGEVLAMEEAELELALEVGIGGGGQRRFVFRAESPGRTALRLWLGRPWLERAAAIDSFVVTVDVEGARA
jgi:inhibitor of cysteine peptidase